MFLCLVLVIHHNISRWLYLIYLPIFIRVASLAQWYYSRIRRYCVLAWFKQFSLPIFFETTLPARAMKLPYTGECGKLIHMTAPRSIWIFETKHDKTIRILFSEYTKHIHISSPLNWSCAFILITVVYSRCTPSRGCGSLFSLIFMR